MHRKQITMLIIITVLVAVFFFAAYELGTALGGRHHSSDHKGMGSNPAAITYSA